MQPVQPVVQPSPSTSTVSFAEIQRAQQEQVLPKQDKRSLKDIQEEERARQVEDDRVNSAVGEDWGKQTLSAKLILNQSSERAYSWRPGTRCHPGCNPSCQPFLL